ncbi:hypothetical protein GQ53DRAFT_509042 [Thozetella sp. PMI_491]|nr:hypothetical protein GQ53DRAFT_509042 [Thozetella sp. PMI_491]
MEDYDKVWEPLQPPIGSFEGDGQPVPSGLVIEPEQFLINYESAETAHIQQQPSNKALAISRKRGRGPQDQNISSIRVGGHDATSHKKQKRTEQGEDTRDSTGAKFACPFFKHDKFKYISRRGCACSRFPTVHRVKEHLFRSHTPPRFRCQRCYECFTSETEISQHLRAEQRCEKRDVEPEEWIDEHRLRALRSRKGPKLTLELEKWGEVYKILFPDANSVPSPYYDWFPGERDVASVSAVFRHIEDFAGSEFPRLLRLEFGNSEHLTTEKVVGHGQAALKKLLRSFEHQVMRQGSTSEDNPDPPRDCQINLQAAVPDHLQQAMAFDLNFDIFPMEE